MEKKCFVFSLGFCLLPSGLEKPLVGKGMVLIETKGTI